MRFSIFWLLWLLAYSHEILGQQQGVDYSYAYYTTLAPPAVGPAFEAPAFQAPTFQAPAPALANDTGMVDLSWAAEPTAIPETTTSTTTAISTTPAKYPFIPKLITYWGQNAAEKVIGTPESSLETLCTKRSPYSTIIIGYVNKFSDEDNIDALPGMSFTIHCRKSDSTKYQSLLYCPEIASDIRYCHDKGIKILIGIGGPNSNSYFESDFKAEKLAKDIWNLFLGGDEMPDLRPFGSVVLDGINMFMEPHTHDLHHDHTFLMTLHNLRRTDLARNYLLTLSPSCLFPDPYFGPGPDKVLQKSISLIDQIYVRYTNPRCCIKGSLGFQRSLSKWKTFIATLAIKQLKSPDMFIGVPATANSVANGACYRTPKELLPIVNLLQKTTKFRGVLVIDNAFDVKDGGKGFTFSKDLLKATLPIHLHEVPKYKPIIIANDSLANSIGPNPVHDDLHLESEDGNDVTTDSDDVSENEDQESLSQPVANKILLKPTQPIVVISTTNTGSDNIEMEKNQTTGHENATAMHSEDDLMTIEAAEQNEDHINHDQLTMDKIKEKLLSNETVAKDGPEDSATTSSQELRIKYQDNMNMGTGKEVDENENQDSENVEEIIEDEREPPINDPVLNSSATTGEFPHGIDVGYPSNNSVSSDHDHNIEISPVHGNGKPKRIQAQKLRDPNDDDFVIPFFDRQYPTISPTAISNRKNWKDMKLKKMQKQNFHKHQKHDHLRPFFDRNLPTLKPTAVSGKHWKNRKNFHHDSASNQSIAETDLWSSIFPKNGSIDHLVSKHIYNRKNKTKTIKRKEKSFCKRCKGRDTGNCECKHLTYEDCKHCKKHLSRKCQKACLTIEKLMNAIDKSINSSLEKEYLSNKFKNYSKIMQEKRIYDEKEKNFKVQQPQDKVTKIISKLQRLIDSSQQSNRQTNHQHKKHGLYDMKNKQILKPLTFQHNQETPHVSMPMYTGKLHTLEIEKATNNKLKFDHISNELKTKVQNLTENQEGGTTRLNHLHFEKEPVQQFPISEEKQNYLFRKLHLDDQKQDKKIAFSNNTKEIIKQAVKLLTNKSKTPTSQFVNEDKDDASGDTSSTSTSPSGSETYNSVHKRQNKSVNQSANLNEIPKMYDDLKNFIVEDIAKNAAADVKDDNEDFQFLYDGDDGVTAVYDGENEGSSSGEPFEEDIVYFYPDGTLQNYASPKKYDSKTYWKEDFEHKVPNVADTMTGERSPDYELKIPNVFNPFGNGGIPLQHGAQMEENSKYLTLLQNDIQKQIDTFNDQIVEEQPVKPEDVKSNNTKPQRLAEEELEKFINTRPDNLFEDNGASNEIVEEENKKHEIIPNKLLEENVKSHSKSIIPKSELKKLIEFSNENNDAFLKFKDFESSTDKLFGKDLISNVNVKGNMDQLKYLMSEMQKTIDNANDAIQEKQMQDLNEVDEEERKNKNKGQKNNEG